jgi:hypothetical protein
MNGLTAEKRPLVGNRSLCDGAFFIDLNNFINQPHPVTMRQKIFCASTRLAHGCSAFSPGKEKNS